MSILRNALDDIIEMECHHADANGKPCSCCLAVYKVAQQALLETGGYAEQEGPNEEYAEEDSDYIMVMGPLTTEEKADMRHAAGMYKGDPTSRERHCRCFSSRANQLSYNRRKNKEDKRE